MADTDRALPLTLEMEGQRRKRSWRATAARLWKLRVGVIGATVVSIIVFSAIFAPLVAPHDPYAQNLMDRLMPPFWVEKGSPDHILGTDRVGRDVLTRIIYGARVSLTVGALGVLMAGSIGVTLGLLAGFYGKTVDGFISAGVNLMLAFPFMLLAIATVAVLGPSFRNMIIVLGLTAWPMYTRVVRSEALRLRQAEFVTAAQSLGARDFRIILRYILPNLLNSVIVLSSLEVARMILVESFLSFLGLGIQPPIPAWGSMLADGRNYLLNMWWLATFPGVAIFMTTLGINLTGDAVRDLLDPRMKNL